ncbi:hypothetical protein B0H34DRAFT_809552 [Crassisporium funariophilum]|nr:hypothetical protein B0H34DRAFT_809552 [Crassisporium funariophilum]
MGKTKKNHRSEAKGPAPQLRSRTTRSSKGRLLTGDPSASSHLLTTQLQSLGLYASPTIGDGNCLFRALSDQLHGSPSQHLRLRADICDWIERHGGRYEPFVEDERGLGVHLRCMRENATYGGHMELSAFAHMTRRNVKVIQPGLVYVIEWAAFSSSSSSSSPSASSSSPGSSSSGSSSQPQPTDQRRRSKRTPGLPKSAKALDAEGEKIKIGTGKHGYYVYEEVSSDEEDGEELMEERVEETRGGEVRAGEREGEGEGGRFMLLCHLVGAWVRVLLLWLDPLALEGPRPVHSFLFYELSSSHFHLSSRTYTVDSRYHDWEHFSSIRNLRGPHSGLPNVRETPAQTEPVPTQREQREWEKEALREKEREKKRERERKTVKIKLRLSAPNSSAGPLAPPSVPVQVVKGLKEQDPALIPLPTSRSASPFPHSSESSAPSSIASQSHPQQPQPHPHPLSLPPTSASPSSSSYPQTQTLTPPPSLTRHPHLQPSSGASPSTTSPSGTASSRSHQHGHQHHRSPKRSFDESSASGGDEADGSGREKRSRLTSRLGLGLASGVGVGVGSVDAAGGEVLVDVDGDGEEADAGTPGLSAPGSSSSSSSTSASELELEMEMDRDRDRDLDAMSELSSPSPSPSPAPEAPPLLSTPKKKGGYLQHQHNAGGEKALTRRQRKALGLPKPRTGAAVGAAGGKAGTGTGTGTGKIVIPGGRWKGRDSAPGTGAGGNGGNGAGGGGAVNVVGNEGEEEEWRRNGTGREATGTGTGRNTHALGIEHLLHGVHQPSTILISFTSTRAIELQHFIVPAHDDVARESGRLHWRPLKRMRMRLWHVTKTTRRGFAAAHCTEPDPGARHWMIAP